MSDIRTKPSSKEYREGWDRVFKRAQMFMGVQRTWRKSPLCQIRTYAMEMPISGESFDALADYVRSGKETGMPVIIVDKKPKKAKRGKR